MFTVVKWQVYFTGALLVLASLGGLWAHGWHTGRQGERATWEARTTALRVARTISASAIAGQAQMLAQVAQERDALAEELEREAHEDDTADLPALGPERVLRLLRR